MPIVICGPWWLVLPALLIYWLWRYTDPKRKKRR
jgi:hypothetical protein